MLFSIAFDSVSHEQLSQKLYVRGKVLSRIEYVPSNRKQIAVLRGFESAWRNVIIGVP